MLEICWLLIRLVLFSYCLEGFKVEMIPSFGPSPRIRHSAQAVFDPDRNRIISYGGFDMVDGVIVNEIHLFDLSSLKWSKVVSHSFISPPGLMNSYMHLRNDSKILMFFGTISEGVSPDVFSFDLVKDIWAIETLKGDVIRGRSEFASASYQDSSNFTKIVIFGGMCDDKASGDLFM